MYDNEVEMVIYAFEVTMTAILAIGLWYAVLRNHLTTHHMRPAVTSMAIMFTALTARLALPLWVRVGLYLDVMSGSEAQEFLDAPLGDVIDLVFLGSLIFVFYTLALAYPEEHRA